MPKLSPAQVAALTDINNGHYMAPKPNTVTSLLKRDLIKEVSSTTGGFDRLELTDSGREAIGLPTVVETKVAANLSREFDAAEYAHGDRATHVAKLTGRPRSWVKRALFGAWAGLTDDEITADLSTARTVPNRADRRAAVHAVKVVNRQAMRRFGRRAVRFGTSPAA